MANKRTYTYLEFDGVDETRIIKTPNGTPLGQVGFFSKDIVGAGAPTATLTVNGSMISNPDPNNDYIPITLTSTAIGNAGVVRENLHGIDSVYPYLVIDYDATVGQGETLVGEVYVVFY